ncbi:MAG: helix-turn-helix domain-containing protein [bacterium]
MYKLTLESGTIFLGRSLAKHIELTDSNLSIFKTRKAKAVRVEMFNALCKELNCQPGDLMEFEKD